MIELHKLAAGYPERRVLERVSLQFPDGQITVLAGPNASGKTTLLRTILGLEPRLDGEIFLDGTAQTDLTARELALRVSYLPQSRPVPNIAAGRMVLHGRFPYLGYPRRMGREDREKVEEALALTDTARYRHRSVAELSGGQRQKVYFAMALAQDTPLVLLDEPATYLDLRHQLELMELIRLLQSRGKTVAAVLHDLPQALEWADRVAVLEDGKIADQGPPAEVFDRGTLDRVFGLASHRLTVEGKERYFFTKAGGAV